MWRNVLLVLHVGYCRDLLSASILRALWHKEQRYYVYIPPEGSGGESIRLFFFRGNRDVNGLLCFLSRLQLLRITSCRSFANKPSPIVDYDVCPARSCEGHDQINTTHDTGCDGVRLFRSGVFVQGSSLKNLGS